MLQQRIQIITHSAVTESNIFIKKKQTEKIFTVTGSAYLAFWISTSAFGCRPRHDLYKNKLAARRDFGHEYVKTQNSSVITMVTRVEIEHGLKRTVQGRIHSSLDTTYQG